MFGGREAVSIRRLVKGKQVPLGYRREKGAERKRMDQMRRAKFFIVCNMLIESMYFIVNK